MPSLMSFNLLGLGIAQVPSAYAVQTLAIPIYKMTNQTAVSMAMFRAMLALRSLLIQGTPLLS